MSVPAQVRLELDFAHHYAVHLLEEADPTSVVRIPNSPEPVDSMYVKIEPKHAHPWIGAFARGFENDELVSGIFSWPDPDSLAVVSAGYGYAGRGADPRSFVRLQPMPITDVRLMPEHKLIIFVDFTHIFAYGPEKTVWKSDRISWDGISITQVATNHLFGVAWDAMQDKEVEFALDVRSGKHTGGAQPWSRR
jgi:hypothetical protein